MNLISVAKKAHKVGKGCYAASNNDQHIIIVAYDQATTEMFKEGIIWSTARYKRKVFSCESHHWYNIIPLF